MGKRSKKQKVEVQPVQEESDEEMKALKRKTDAIIYKDDNNEKVGIDTMFCMSRIC